MFNWFNDTFFEQVKLQEKIKNVDSYAKLPNVVDMYGAATGMIIEVGEMLQEDTRWKEKITGSPKKPTYNKLKFLEELADVYIYFMNVIIYSEISINEFQNKVSEKQKEVKERFNENA